MYLLILNFTYHIRLFYSLRRYSVLPDAEGSHLLLKQQLCEKDVKLIIALHVKHQLLFPSMKNNFIKLVELKLVSCHLAWSCPLKIVNRLLKFVNIFYFQCRCLFFTFHKFSWRFWMLDVDSFWESSVLRCGAGKEGCAHALPGVVEMAVSSSGGI